ncbi:MAG: hypothetical protein WAN12_19670 [Candidatus Acidiferrum sp.]
MPTEIIAKGELRKVRYRPPTRGQINLYVESSGAVSIYLVDVADIKTLFVKPLPGVRFYDKTSIDKKIEVNFDDDWYLVIRNKTDESVAVHWEVYF